ncbi:MAG: DapH/DapD/GlmU-related protein [Hyphomicrobium sp.]
MAFRISNFIQVLKNIKNTNAKGEYYLTDAVEIIRQRELASFVVRCNEEEVLGVNSRSQLAIAENIWQQRMRNKVMEKGVTLRAPHTVFFNFDTVLGVGVTIEQNVIFGPNVKVQDGVHIHAFCHIEGAEIGKDSRIGPFARLRPGSRLENDVHIGNFVEVKNVVLGARSKANHLSYLGDGTIGEEVNIGAGTIFCNYDGFFKYKTNIGSGAFIGSNSSLVAPVSVGEGAYVGSGSVITKDVPAQALALERSVQVDRPQWAVKFRAAMRERKKKN